MRAYVRAYVTAYVRAYVRAYVTALTSHLTLYHRLELENGLKVTDNSEVDKPSDLETSGGLPSSTGMYITLFALFYYSHQNPRPSLNHYNQIYLLLLHIIILHGASLNIKNIW